MKKIAVILICALMALPGMLKAQDYERSIGIRFGLPFGLAYKHAVGNDQALEFIAAGTILRELRGLTLTGLYEFHFYPFTIDGLFLYAGVGGHAGLYSANQFGNQGTFNFGPNAIIGIEYYFYDAPVSISLDFMPTYNIFSPASYESEGAISIRYVLE